MSWTAALLCPVEPEENKISPGCPRSRSRCRISCVGRSLETRQSRLVTRIEFEQRLDSGNRHELGFLRSNRSRQRDRDAAAFNQRQHERDRIWRKIRLDGCDRSGRDPIFPQIVAPMIRPVQKFAVCETLVAPYDRLGLRILTEHLE